MAQASTKNGSNNLNKLYFLYHLHFLGMCGPGHHPEWIMGDKQTVPNSLISIYDPEGLVKHDVDVARPGDKKLEFYKMETEKPSVTVDIDQKGHPHSYADVYIVKINNGNIETVNIFKKTTDADKTWTKVYTGEVPANGEITLAGGEQMGLIKIEPETGSEDIKPEYYVFDFDVAVCAYGTGKIYCNCYLVFNMPHRY